MLNLDDFCRMAAYPLITLSKTFHQLLVYVYQQHKSVAIRGTAGSTQALVMEGKSFGCFVTTSLYHQKQSQTSGPRFLENSQRQPATHEIP